MVVLAASICTKGGKAILSRQFIEMPRSRIEGLLASFPKLIGSSDQHTFVETDSVRFVYQPLDELFMVLVTNKQSNILQDIGTLHLFARVVSEYCRSTDERDISKQSMELLNVFDEIIAMGYRESVSLPQIRTITDMESHEERVQAEIEKTKEKEAKDELNRKARMMDAQKREMAKKGYGGSGIPNISGGFGSGGGGGGGQFQGQGGYKPANPSYQEAAQQSSFDSFSSGPSRAMGGKGMQLGRKQKADAMVEAIKTEEGIEDRPTQAGGAMGGGSTAAAVHTESVHAAIQEKISLKLHRDGGLEKMEVKGTLTLRVSDPSKAFLRLRLNPLDKDRIQFNTHPNVDKALYGDGIIGLKDPSRPFPTGVPLGLLKWRMESKDDAFTPLSINCWPSPSGTGTCDVNIEYELQAEHLDLRDVTISVPYPGSAPPTVGDVEGHYKVDRQGRKIEWQLPLIDRSNKSGVLEFSVESEDVSGFFPIRVSFNSSQTFCGVDIVDINDMEGNSVTYSRETEASTDDYSVA